MLTLQIKCIVKTNRKDPHERIHSIGGTNQDNKRWGLSEDDAIAGIEAGNYKFWSAGGGKSVWVVIAKSAAGHKYLKTEADGSTPDNLLRLPPCP